jgi:hypothetical protein
MLIMVLQENKPLTYGAWDEFPNPPLLGDDVANNPEGLAAFSSRGPILPAGIIESDVVAPGTTILSTRSTHIADGHRTDFWGKSSGATVEERVWSLHW